MNKKEKLLSRREMLALGLGGIALAGSVFAQEKRRLITPPFDVGPFYPVAHPKDIDADLTLIEGRKKRAEGDIIYVEGLVLNIKGEPISGAKIEIWQANKFGRYAHPSDTHNAPLDENFQGFAVINTDSQGRYRFKTVKPGAYPVNATHLRTPHIHFDVMGKNNRLATQMFFPGESLNEKDILLSETRARFELLKRPSSNADALIAKALPATGEIEAGATRLSWDIVLING
ncbi:MAG: putative Protocatechuate 3,4-dioxygenase [Acidobacteria bacterium]|jgi:protocatechuate 3,4-dioxygenase beta subunit|nr:putative Protocatechuate 3,4-dioxygenase [Acidobacteriota bacterium]